MSLERIRKAVEDFPVEEFDFAGYYHCAIGACDRQGFCIEDEIPAGKDSSRIHAFLIGDRDHEWDPDHSFLNMHRSGAWKGQAGKEVFYQRLEVVRQYLASQR